MHYVLFTIWWNSSYPDDIDLGIHSYLNANEKQNNTRERETRTREITEKSEARLETKWSCYIIAMLIPHGTCVILEQNLQQLCIVSFHKLKPSTVNTFSILLPSVTTLCTQKSDTLYFSVLQVLLKLLQHSE